MTTTDELRRVLRAQAEETDGWPPPRVPATPTAPHRPGRPLLAVLAAVGLVVAVALVPRLVPRDGGPDDPSRRPATSQQRTPAPTTPPTSVASILEWTAADCPPTGGCTVPDALLAGDVRLVRSGTGASAPTHHGAARSASVSFSLDGGPRTRWYLVGARGSGASSRLEVAAGAVAAQLEPGRLTLVRLDSPGRDDRLVLRELARPLPQEQLVVQEYALAP